MKQSYISARRLSLWMRLTKKWNTLYTKIQTRATTKSLKKLNNLSLLLGVKRKIALSTLVGFVTVGAQAQLDFVEVTETSELYFSEADVGLYAAPTFADLDGDDDLDFILGGAIGELAYFTNTTGVFTEQKEDNIFDGINVGYNSVPTFVDLDKDGDLDIILGEGAGLLTYFTNTNGVFTEQTGINNPFDAVDVEYQSTPAFADFDDDGDLDLIVGEEYGTIKYFTNTNNVFTEQTGLNNPFDGVDVGYHSAPTYADLDDDGDLDLVVGELNGTINYFENNDLVFTEQTGLNNPFIGFDVGERSKPSFADLDNDGDLDLVVGESGGSIVEYKNATIVSGVFSNKTIEVLNIYPNPATSIINTELGELEILDALGTYILSTESTGKVDVSSLESGIYIIIQNEKRTKLIIE